MLLCGTSECDLVVSQTII